MLSCKEVAKLCASEDIQRCSFWRKLLFRMHHLLCHGCRDYESQMMKIGEVARDIEKPVSEETRQELESGIMNRLESDTAE